MNSAVLSLFLVSMEISCVESIRNWLNGNRDYHVGIALYDAHGDNMALKEMFAQGHSDYRQLKLVSALDDLLATLPEQNVLPAAPEHISVTVGHTIMPENRLPADKDPYRDKWLPTYNKMKFLQHQLAGDMTDESRGQLAHEILDLEQECMYWWERADIYNKTGFKLSVDPMQYTNQVTDQNLLRKRLNNVRPSISKCRKRLADDPDDQDTQARLAGLIAERYELERKLNIKAKDNEHPDS